MSANKITGGSAFLALHKDEGITHLFGNPGTTELPIMDALSEHPDLNYLMSMQESLVVYMAECYSRASGKLSACNVHVAPGLWNAMRAIYAAKFAKKSGADSITIHLREDRRHINDIDLSRLVKLKKVPISELNKQFSDKEIDIIRGVYVLYDL